jgi:hypothetical protein
MWLPRPDRWPAGIPSRQGEARDTLRLADGGPIMLKYRPPLLQPAIPVAGTCGGPELGAGEEKCLYCLP